jgi:phosphosulfolactate phosphohydrolase-like enzyme
MSETDRECDIIRAQDYYNWLENKLINIIHKLAPLARRHCVNSSGYNEKNSKQLINKHRHLVARWNLRKNVDDRLAANELKKMIRKETLENRKNKIRRNIKP